MLNVMRLIKDNSSNFIDLKHFLNKGYIKAFIFKAHFYQRIF